MHAAAYSTLALPLAHKRWLRQSQQRSITAIPSSHLISSHLTPDSARHGHILYLAGKLAWHYLTA